MDAQAGPEESPLAPITFHAALRPSAAWRMWQPRCAGTIGHDLLAVTMSTICWLQAGAVTCSGSQLSRSVCISLAAKPKLAATHQATPQAVSQKKGPGPSSACAKLCNVLLLFPSSATCSFCSPAHCGFSILLGDSLALPHYGEPAWPERSRTLSSGSRTARLRSSTAGQGTKRCASLRFLPSSFLQELRGEEPTNNFWAEAHILKRSEKIQMRFVDAYIAPVALTGLALWLASPCWLLPVCGAQLSSQLQFAASLISGDSSEVMRLLWPALTRSMVKPELTEEGLEMRLGAVGHCARRRS